MYSLSRDHKPTDSGEQWRILKEGGRIYRTEMVRLKRERDGDGRGDGEEGGKEDSRDARSFSKK